MNPKKKPLKKGNAREKKSSMSGADLPSQNWLLYSFLSFTKTKHYEGLNLSSCKLVII